MPDTFTATGWKGRRDLSGWDCSRVMREPGVSSFTPWRIMKMPDARSIPLCVAMYAGSAAICSAMVTCVGVCE